MTTSNNKLVKIGTCSWNYDSWVGLVYTERKRTSAEYLREYSQRFDTAEIDSWFYKIPERSEILSYIENAEPGFTFTCKIPEQICLTHIRSFGQDKKLEPNPDFLSGELFETFLQRIEPIMPQMDALIMEFEYLNKEKMPSKRAFIEQVGQFVRTYSKGLPVAIECRNSNYLDEEYFEFIENEKLIHVFSEKQYMPHIYDLYEKYKQHVKGCTVLRLLGGDRKEIEEKTSKEWNKIVDEKADKAEILKMTKDIKYNGNKVIINVNNHFEGSAPLTVESLKVLLKE